MKRIGFATVVVVLALGGMAAAQADKAKTRSTLGVVTAVTGSSFTIENGSKSMTFNIDSSTYIAAKGAGTKAREKKEAGQGGLTVADAVHEGDQVLVKYHTANGTMMAREIQVRDQRPLSAQPQKKG
jgi:hypothetical protein